MFYSLLFVHCCELAENIEAEEKALTPITDLHHPSDDLDKIFQLRSQTFALFKFMAELCYSELVPITEIISILDVLVSDGFKQFIDFGKIVLILCGMQHKIYEHQSLTDLFNTFLKVTESNIENFGKREKIVSEVILIEL